MSAAMHARASSESEPAGEERFRAGSHVASGLEEPDDPEDLLAKPVDRELLLSSVQRHADRAKYCWALPFALATYALCTCTFIAHVQTESAFELETALQFVIDDGTASSFGSSTDVFTWLSGVIVPAMYTSVDSDASSIAASVNTYSHLVGGVRLSQARSAAAACAITEPFKGIVSGMCYPELSASTAAFGDAGTAARYNVSGAFTPITIPTDWLAQTSTATQSTFGPFEQVLHAQESETSMASKVQGLEAAGWIDVATKRVDVDVAVLNLEISRWARIVFSILFTRGGRIDVTKTIRSVSVDPYVAQPSLVTLDVLVLLYTVVLLLSLLYTLYTKLHKVLHTPMDALASTARHLLTVWTLIDLGALLGLLATGITWALAVTTLANLRLAVSQAKWQPSSIEMDVIRAHAVLSTALQHFSNFKHAGCATLVFLTLKLFWQFSLQPRLAVITEVLRRAIGDMLHFGIVFTVIMVAFGVWGHVAFGSQLSDWRTTSEASFSTMRLLMYDYDLVGMQRADPLAASVFFGSFMFLMTNLILWMFLAILLETYTVVRNETHEAPSAWADLMAGVAAFPGRVRTGLEWAKSKAFHRRGTQVERPLVLDDGCASQTVGEGRTGRVTTVVDVRGLDTSFASTGAEEGTHGARFAAPALPGDERPLSLLPPSAEDIIDVLTRPPLNAHTDVTLLNLARTLHTEPRVVLQAVTTFTASSGNLYESRMRVLAGLFRNPRLLMQRTRTFSAAGARGLMNSLMGGHTRRLSGATPLKAPRAVQSKEEAGDTTCTRRSLDAASEYVLHSTPAPVRPAGAAGAHVHAEPGGRVGGSVDVDVKEKLGRLLRVTAGLAAEMAELQVSIETLERVPASLGHHAAPTPPTPLNNDTRLQRGDFDVPAWPT